MTWKTQEGVFDLGDFVLQSGEVLRNARLSWKAYGELSPARDNVMIYPTSFAAQHNNIDWLIHPDGVLDPTKWFVVIPDMFGNGLSSSPSNTPDYPELVTTYDNVQAQHRLIQHMGIERLACAYGWSMGAQQAYHWAALFPQAVERVVINCGSARTSPHNQVFLASLMAVLEAAPEYLGQGRFSAHPQKALRAFGRVYAGWALSQGFYRQGKHLHQPDILDLETYLSQTWDGRFAIREAANLYAHLKTWSAADISQNTLYNGDLNLALSSIEARVLLMPGSTDLYFRVADNKAELPHLRAAQLSPIPSSWGHLAGNPVNNEADTAFIRTTVRQWLGDN